MAKVQGKEGEIMVLASNLLLSVGDGILADGVTNIPGTTFEAEITPLAQWECPVHGKISPGYESLSFFGRRPGLAKVRHYCALCWEDALRAAGVNEFRLVLADEDADEPTDSGAA